MADQQEVVAQAAMAVVQEWFESCRRGKEPSRNTIAVGMTVLDWLRETCPLPKAETLAEGGEFRRVRSGLSRLFAKYGIPANFLKEATGRQASPDAQRLLDMLEEGRIFAPLSHKQRDALLLSLLAVLIDEANKWLGRQNLKVSCSRESSPGAWVGEILSEAKGKSGGRVEQHLVGAKLAKAYPDADIPALPGAAADVQTGRAGDFQVETTVYHVTAAPGDAVVQKCEANLRAGLHPVLLVPAKQKLVADGIVDRLELSSRIWVISIEDFLSVNILEMSHGRRQEFITTLRSIVEEYNLRIDAAETDKSLKIEIE